MITLGIDPGLTGAVGVLKDGQYTAVFDIPSIAKGSGTVKREIDPSGLAREITAIPTLKSIAKWPRSVEKAFQVES